MRFPARVLYDAAARLASRLSGVVPASGGKAAIAMRARHGIRERYHAWADRHRDRDRKLLWTHAPSVGEGLQARPVLALLRDKRPELQLAYTFFSPSAEEFSRSLDVDFREYLPFDNAPDMRSALDALTPSAIVFSKLDVWPGLVREAKQRGIPCGMISATMAPTSGRSGFFASVILRDAYAALDAVGAITDEDAQRLTDLGVRPEVITVTGDTRFDQVWIRAEALDRGAGLVHRLASDRPTLVAGSTWPSDEVVLLPALAGVKMHIHKFRAIIAPHETSEEHIRPIEEWATAAKLKCARVDSPEAADADIIIVDRFGVLGDLYALASVAYVGGAFHDAGIHSVLEPAAFGSPVLFGPRHRSSRDPATLIKAGAARAVRSSPDLERFILDWLRDEPSRRDAGAIARGIVESGKGAAQRSLAIIERLLDGR